MPRSNNPGDIQIGKGRVPAGTVEDNSLRNPNRDVQPLKAHIDDPSRAHWADTIAIEDVAGNFVSDEVEGALAELAGTTGAGVTEATFSATRMNGWLSGGTFTTAGLNLTLVAGSVILQNGASTDYSSDSVVLTDNATNYVYIDVSTSTLVTSPSAPTLASEDVFVARVVTAAGAVTGFLDGRWFVANLDRKPSLTVRSSGSAFNQQSEANFVTLDAAMLWLEEFAGAGADPMETHTVVVRGAHTISAPVSIPVNYVSFVGDGEATITTSGAFNAFELNNRDYLGFKNLTVACGGAPASAFFNSATLDFLKIHDCVALSAGSDWEYFVNIGGTANKASILRCTAQVENGILINQTNECIVQDLALLGTAGAGGAGTVGIEFSTLSLPRGKSVIRGGNLRGFETGMILRDVTIGVSDYTIADVVNGIVSGSPVGNFRNVNIELDSTLGESGVQLESATNNQRFTNCSVNSQRAAGTYGATIPSGWNITNCDQVSLTDCSVSGIYSDSSLSFGILADGTSDRILVTGGHIGEARIAISFSGDRCSVTGTNFSGVGQAIFSSGDDTVITGVAADLDATYSVTGASCSGQRTHVGNSSFIMNRTWTTEPDFPTGISVSGSSKVTGCTVEAFNNDGTSPGGQGIRVATATGASGATVVGNTVDQCFDGIVLEANTGMSQLKVEGNNILGGEATRYGIWADASGVGVIRDLTINNNSAHACLGAGVYVLGAVQNLTMNGNNIDGFLTSDPNEPTSEGIWLLAASGKPVVGATISGNTIWRCRNGMSLQGLPVLADFLQDIKVTGNTVRYCGYAQDVNTSTPDTYEGRGSKGIGAEYVQDLHVTDNSISQIGQLINDSGVEAFPFISAPANDVQSNGILTRNCLYTQVCGNRVVNMRATGQTDGGTVDVPANSIIVESRSSGLAAPLANEGVRICENYIYRESSLTGHRQRGIQLAAAAGTDGFSHRFGESQLNNNSLVGPNLIAFGIELLAEDAGAIRQTQVNGNHVEGPGAGPAGSVNAINCVKAGTTGDISNLTIMNNQIQSFSQHGIGVAQAGSTGLRNVLIVGNQIDAATESGVFFEYSGTSSCEQVRIAGNQMQLYETYGIQVSFGTTAARVVRIQILDNEFFSEFLAQDDHIHVDWGNVDLYGLKVCGNQILGEENISAETGTGGIVLVGTGTDAVATGGLYDSQVTGNAVHMDSGNSACLDISLAGPMVGVTVADNVFRSEGGNIPCFRLINDHAFTTPPDDTLCERVAVHGNTFDGGAALGTAGVQWSFTGYKLREMAFCGNQVANSGHGLGGAAGFSVALTQADLGATSSVDGFQVNGNQFQDVQGNGVYLNFAQGTGNTDPIDNVSASDNSFSNCPASGSTPTLRVANDSFLRACSFDRNSFVSCAAGLDSFDARIDLNIARLESVSISGNKMADCGGSGIVIEDGPTAVSGWGFDTLNICDNQMRNQRSVGLHINASAMLTTSQLQVTGNNMRRDFAGGTPDTGIYIIGSTGSGVLNGFIIADNTLEGFTSSGTNGAIDLDMGEGLSRGSISRNSISSTSRSGILVVTDSFMRDVQLDENIIDGASEHGISVFLNGADPGADASNISISRNRVNNVGSIGIYYRTDDSGSSIVPTRNLQINDNVVIDFTQGVLVATDDSTTGAGSARQADLLNSSVSGNQTYGFAGSIPGQGGVGVQVDGAMHSCRIDNNMVENVGRDGVTAVTFSGEIFNTSVSGNHVLDPFQGTGSGWDGISLRAINVGTFTGSFFCNTVSNNNVFMTSSGSTSSIDGLVVEANATCRNVTVSGNNIHFNGNGTTTTGFRFNATSNGVQTPDQSQWSVTGNNSRGVDTGVAIGAAFSPTRSTMNGNTSNDAGADWHDVVAAVGTGTAGFEDGSGASTNNPAS